MLFATSFLNGLAISSIATLKSFVVIFHLSADIDFIVERAIPALVGGNNKINIGSSASPPQFWFLV
jgi:hypothetical protein